MGPVFLCHGSWPDNAWFWTDELAERLREEGIEAAVVPYTVLVGFGTGAPAKRIASFEGELRARHSRSSCRAPLRLMGVGYSSGTEVLALVAEEGARLERCWFAGSPLSLWNGTLRQALRAGRIGRLVNWFSPLDGLMWITAGSGVFGYHGAGWSQVDNRVHFWPHVMPRWRREYAVDELIEELLALGLDQPRHTCWTDPAYRAWYRSARESLRVEW